ncbi:hypothetical protein TanjilG_09920 [Lupinus angustifolius]|uniref:Uncharacterized protein n=1 Tax=Lupinus angustifolius TaxID=3871 RepID=A0A1J7ILP5_LUPAN|nr:hypothetical protein TanjilG_09920 [Lupinus angustifolius]
MQSLKNLGNSVKGGGRKRNLVGGENEKSIEGDAEVEEVQMLGENPSDLCVVPVKECKGALAKLVDKDKSSSLLSVPIIAVDSLDWTNEAAFCIDKVSLLKPFMPKGKNSKRSIIEKESELEVVQSLSLLDPAILKVVSCSGVGALEEGGEVADHFNSDDLVEGAIAKLDGGNGPTKELGLSVKAQKAKKKCASRSSFSVGSLKIVGGKEGLKGVFVRSKFEVGASSKNLVPISAPGACRIADNPFSKRCCTKINRNQLIKVPNGIGPAGQQKLPSFKQKGNRKKKLRGSRKAFSKSQLLKKGKSNNGLIEESSLGRVEVVGDSVGFDSSISNSIGDSNGQQVNNCFLTEKGGAAGKLWKIGKSLGVSFEGDDSEMIRQDQDEDGDRMGSRMRMRIG